MVRWVYYFYDYSDPNELFLISNPKEAHMTLRPENSFYKVLPLMQGSATTFHWHSWKLFKRHWRTLTWLLDMEEIPTQTPRHSRCMPCPGESSLNKFPLSEGAPTPFQRNLFPNFARCGYNAGKPLPEVMKSRSPWSQDNQSVNSLPETNRELVFITNGGASIVHNAARILPCILPSARDPSSQEGHSQLSPGRRICSFLFLKKA